MARLVDHRKQLGQVYLQRRLAQIGLEGRVPGLAPREQRVAQSHQLGHALRRFRLAQRQRGRPLARKEIADPVQAGIVAGQHGRSFQDMRAGPTRSAGSGGTSLRKMRVTKRFGKHSDSRTSQRIENGKR